MKGEGKTTRTVIVEQLELHFSNFVYVAIGIAVFWMMYLMADCMYTKETGFMILGWIGILIQGKRPAETTNNKTVVVNGTTAQKKDESNAP